jgi:hypothetical protein
MNFLTWFSTPQTSSDISKRNFINVQIDAIGVGLAAGAAPFLPVFLTRLGASSFQIGMLTAMPAMTGFLFAIAIGVLLQRQRKIIPWFSFARLAVIFSYALTGIVAFFVPRDHLIISILAVWALATIPQTILAISFSVVMNAVAGPSGRYELMTRRWSILGVTTAVTVFTIGRFLDHINFPLNYQLVFIALSMGGMISYYFSSHISIPDTAPPPRVIHLKLKTRIEKYFKPVINEKPFISFSIKRFVYLFGMALGIPIFPIFFVRHLLASDSWISTFSTVQTSFMIIGYFFWSRQSQKHGSRVVLLWTTLGISLYPILTSFSNQIWPIAIYAGIAGIFQAGLDLVFFDELLRTIPPEYSATFVSLAQSLQHFSSIAAPLIGSWIADSFSPGTALFVSGLIRLFAFFLFFFVKRNPSKLPTMSKVGTQ